MGYFKLKMIIYIGSMDSLVKKLIANEILEEGEA